jgi:hypothetical protein
MHFAAGEDCDVFDHRFAAIAEARGLDGADVDGAAQLCSRRAWRGFAFDVFRDDRAGALPTLATFSSIGSKILEAR